MKPFILLVCALHILWGIILLGSDAPVGATPISGLARTIPQQQLLAVALVLSSLAAYRGLRERAAIEALPWVAPQLFLLWLSGCAAVRAVITGTYADGVVRPETFILADQLPITLIAAAVILITAYSVLMDWLDGRYLTQGDRSA